MERKYLIIGAGHQGMAMSAHFALNGESVLLWNRTRANVKEIMESYQIESVGVVNGTAKLERVSDRIEDVLTDTIFIATPSTAYRDIAKMLAKLLFADTMIYLNPGRTFGAIEFYEELQKNGCTRMPIIVETQSIVYTCRKTGRMSVSIYALKNLVEMAHIGGTDAEVRARMPDCIRDRFVLANSVLDTSFGNIGMILHCAPVLLNIGWIESDKYEFKYYYDGISETISNVLEKMDRERIAVALRMGVRTKSLPQWFADAYRIRGATIAECIKKNEFYRDIDAPRSLTHRYLDEDIPNGLVPIEYLGKDLGVDVSAITSILDLANLVKKKDYRAEGRKIGAEKLQTFLKLLD